MREIKFRAWDKQSKIWRYFTLPDIASIHENEWKMTDFQHWCQFTGILDKNRKEVFEGDILEDGGEIKYENGAFFIHHRMMKPYYLYDEINGTGNIRFKKIGNIYENSDLIK